MNTPVFVGRENELQNLLRLFQQAKKGTGNMVFVAGEPGSGKSTLAHHFLSKTENQCFTAIAECADRESNNAYRPFKEVLVQLNTQTSETGAKEENRKKLWQVINEVGPDWIGLIPFFGEAIKTGIHTARSLQKHAKNTGQQAIDHSDLQATIIGSLQKFANKKTLVIFIDDLQWCDHSSLNLLFELGKTLTNKPFPLFLVGTYRPHEIEAGRNKIAENGDTLNIRHPFASVLNELKTYTRGQGKNKSLHEISLQLFENQEVQKLIKKKYPQNEFPADFSRQLTSFTKGNPLFVSEILASLHEKGSIFAQNNGTYILKQGTLDSLPNSIQGVISERVQRLSVQLRKILECASVDGENFNIQVIEKVLKIDLLDLADYIQELSQKHGLVAQDSTRKFKDSLLELYRFTHILIQKYVYEHLEPLKRRALHSKIAEIMKWIYGQEIEKNKDLKDQYLRHVQISRGLLDGISLRLSETSQRTAQKPNEKLKKNTENQANTAWDTIGSVILDSAKLKIAKAEQLFRQSAMFEVINQSDEALGFLSRVAEQNQELENLQYNALRWKFLAQEWLAHYKDAEKTIARLRQLAESLAEKQKISETFRFLGLIHEDRQDYEKALYFYEQSLNLNQQQQNTTQTGQDLLIIADLKALEKKSEEALIFYQQAAQNFTQIHALPKMALCMEKAADVLVEMQNTELAENFYTQAIQQLENSQHTGQIARLQQKKAQLLLAQKLPQQAASLLENAIQLFEKTGLVYAKAESQKMLASVYKSQQENQKAQQFFEAAAESFERMNNTVGAETCRLQAENLSQDQNQNQNRIEMPATKDTPYVLLDQAAGIIKIHGNSIPENALGFYKPVIDWISENCNEQKLPPQTQLEAHFSLDLLNTSTNKQLAKILLTLEQIAGNRKTKVFWCFSEEENNTYETGKRYQKLLKIPFEFVRKT